MAFDFSKLNFFTRLDARARVFVLFGGVIGVIVLIYLATSYFSSDQATLGPSQVAGAPSNLQSVPGGQLTAEYSKALQQANTQVAQQATMSGDSAVPTLMNYGGGQGNAAPSTNCNIICTDQQENVKYSLEEWVKQGKISPEVSAALQELANRNVPVKEFEIQLSQLVKDGKITPDQARDLLEQYKKQHKNTLLQESAAGMDTLIKSGTLPIEVANELLIAQKSNVSPQAYNAKLQQMVAEGKISADVARQLAGDYAQQVAREATNQRVANVREMAKNGQLVPEAEATLVQLEKDSPPLKDYAEKVQQMVNEGKLTPAAAQKLVDGYKEEKLRTATTSFVVDERISKAEDTSINSLEEMVKTGKVSRETANELISMIRKNVSVDEYENQLSQLVKAGKITPDDAQAKLDEYKTIKNLRQQQDNTSNNAIDVKQSEQNIVNSLDALTKLGKISSETANIITDSMKKNVSLQEHEAMLAKLVKEGKITPEDAQAQLDQYRSLKMKRDQQDMINNNSQAVKNSEDSIYRDLDEAVKSGKLSNELSQTISGMVKKNVSVEEYEALLQKEVKDGRLAPDVAAAMTEKYKKLKTLRDTPDSLQMLRKAEEATYRQLDDLAKAGTIAPDAAQTLSDLVQKNVSPQEYEAAVSKLVEQKKIPPDVGAAQIGQYASLKKLRNMRDSLQLMQANRAAPAAYREELQNWVKNGVITAEQATRLMDEYQSTGAASTGNAASDQTQAAIEALMAQAQPATATPADQFAAKTPKEIEREQILSQQQLQQMQKDEQAKFDALLGAMQGQASQLVSAWQPTAMSHTEGSGVDPAKEAAEKAALANGGTGSKSATDKSKSDSEGGAPLIKSGTILFAVLDTGVNSDYPNTPVMATIVDGQYKGAKLLGKLQLEKSVVGQQDRVSLTFSMMNMDAWIKSKSVNAFAIDPDTARTVLASHVDYHYMQRFGAIMATSFLEGYASAITQAGTSTTGIFGTSTTHPALSQSQKIFTALGQMGTTLGEATKNYVNLPPTVKVDAGVGLGILFMSDVT